jgi:putative transposase
VTPKLFCVLDDHCRVVGHIQWYYHETAETFIHGLSQALLKWGLPYSLMTDNGPAMIAVETEQGLADLSITHALTLPYTPEMNAKQESFWNRLETHLCAMLENQPQLTLDVLNRATHAWLQFDYHVTKHDELGISPLDCMERGTSVLRPRPEPDVLERLFTAVVDRSQRRSDGTVSYENVRYEVPSFYRHQRRLTLRARRWDKSWVYLYDRANATFLERIYPVDKQANADGRRRLLPAAEPSVTSQPSDSPREPIAPKLQKHLSAMDAQGLPPPFICLREQPPTDDQQPGREQCKPNPINYR